MLVANFSPTLLNMQRGFFGEVLICKILEEFHGYTIPVQKWRYAITRNQSLTGTDALAVKVDHGNITEVCFVETKLRTTNNITAAKEGFNQLKNDYSTDLPSIIIFTLSRLEERNDPLLPAFQAYFLNRKDMTEKESLYLGLVWEEKIWTDDVLTNLQTVFDKKGLPALTVNKATIKNLSDLVGQLYHELRMGDPKDDE